MDAAVPGIDADALTTWFTEFVPGTAPPLRFELVAGGRSNLTFTVTDTAGGAWVLRRPPLHGVLPSAHDMSREHRIISALAGTPVPVPRAVGLCEDPAVNGAPFYVMDYVDGVVLRGPGEAAELEAGARRSAGESLVDVLVALHDLAPADVGLGELGRQEGYIARQLRRWHGQWQQSRTRDLPLMDELAQRLTAAIPEQGPARIVHGDFRLDNAIVAPADGHVRAILDWELCTLGDPLADVGLLLVYWSEPGDEVVPLLTSPTAVPGFLTRTEILRRYEAGSGRDLSRIDYYVAFGYWKLAAILEGVYARFVSGAYGEPDEHVLQFANLVVRLAETADERARAVGC